MNRTVATAFFVYCIDTFLFQLLCRFFILFLIIETFSVFRCSPRLFSTGTKLYVRRPKKCIPQEGAIQWPSSASGHC